MLLKRNHPNLSCRWATAFLKFQFSVVIKLRRCKKLCPQSHLNIPNGKRPISPSLPFSTVAIHGDAVPEVIGFM